MRGLVVLGLLGCAGPESRATLERDDPAAAADLSGHAGRFEIRWNGQPIGEARERLVETRDGFRLERRERWRVSRGGALIAGELSIDIATTPDLAPIRIEVRGSSGPSGSAWREGEAWRVEVEGEAPRIARGLPLEILPLLMARRAIDRWSGPVLMPGLGFAPAHAVVAPDGENARWVQISGPAGSLSIRVLLRPGGAIERAVGPDLSIHRIAPPERSPPGHDAGSRGMTPWVSQAAAPRPPPDLLTLGGIEVAGRPSGAVLLETTDGDRVELEAGRPVAGCRAPDCGPAVPDPPPSAAIGRLADRLAGRSPSPADQIARLARATADLLVGDRADPEARAALLAARGRTDCVGHAALFAALAGARGHTVRLVTGYRLDGRRLVRHAWAIASVDGASIAVDPTTGGSAAGDRYFPLAVHGSAAAELALSAELAYAGLTGARARFIDPRSARSIPRTP